MAELEVKYLRLADLLPYARNSRTHSDQQIAQIAASIKEFGFTNPILISPDKDIIAGHGRALAAAKLGLEAVPTIQLGHLTPTQRKAYVIADNRLALNAGWDTSMLSLELLDLKADDFDLDLLGFGDDELQDILNPEQAPGEGLTDPDAVPENAETRCKPGDLWVLGNHRLLCGDSTNVQHVDQLMADQKADMVFTDPPYNVGYEGNIWSSGRIKTGKPDWEGGIKNDKMAAKEFAQFIADAYASIDLTVREGAPIYICFPSGRDGWHFIKAWEPMDWHFQSTLVWLKSHLLISRWDYHPIYEPILYGWKQGAAHEFHGERNQSCVLEHKSAQRQNEAGLHPTQKPISLIEQCIKNSSRPGALLFEPFGGSGSTLIACEKTNRVCRTMELDPKYCDVILKRWEQFTGKEAKLA